MDIFFPFGSPEYRRLPNESQVRSIKADKLLAENIRTLLYRRGIDQKDLAQWCGHKPAWLTKILKGERGVQMDEVGMIADFFGLTVAELFSPGISPLAERRKQPRRGQVDRRQLHDRRGGHKEGALHPDVQANFPDAGGRTPRPDPAKRQTGTG